LERINKKIEEKAEGYDIEKMKKLITWLFIRMKSFRVVDIIFGINNYQHSVSTI